MPAPTLPQRYAIASLLGQGGQGRVYRVRDALRDRELALKLVSASDAEFLRREFDTLRQIRHENLIQVFDWGTLDSGEAYYTMELVEGEDWGRRMGTPQPAEEVRRILTGLLRGLAHLHCHGEIHGDLKPGNILLGRGGVVRVTDVGMGESGAGGIAGTPGYTAPECWEGKPADIRADLYAVGVMAYEALTGKHPFGGRTIREVVAGQLEGWVPSPGAHRVKVPADLERVAMRALERDASLRQGSADEFMEGFGVEDRVGVILGGRFVAREREINSVMGVLDAESPGRPSTIVISGPPGAGKTAFLEYLLLSIPPEKADCIWVTTLDELARRLISEIPERRPSHGRTASLQDIADLLQQLRPNRRTVVVVDGEPLPSGEIERIFRIGRLLWAAALEMGRSSDATFLVTSVARVGELEPHVLVVPVDPLEEAACEKALLGILGHADLTPEYTRETFNATGGLPAAIADQVADHVAQKVLVRTSGRWQARRFEATAHPSPRTVTGRWPQLWMQLSGSARRMLAQLAVVPVPLSLRLARAISDAAAEDSVSILESLGWVRKRGEELSLSSESARTAALMLSSPSELQDARREVLTDARGVLDSDLVAELRLEMEATSGDIDAVISAGILAARRGEVPLALRRLERGLSHLDPAAASEEKRAAWSVYADCLLRAGRPAEALVAIDRIIGSGASAAAPPAPHSAAAQRIRGIACLALGNHAEAVSAFQAAASQAEADADIPEMLRSKAAIAEFAWTHGTADDRVRAIREIREVLSSTPASDTGADERAELAHGLGSALIRSGSRNEGREVLEQAYGTRCSEYWKMRIANAILAAEYFLSNYDSAITWSHRAIEHAERSGSDDMRARILGNRAGVLYARGRLRESIEQDQAALGWARRTGSLFELASAHANLGMNLFLLGRYADSRRMAIETASLARRMGDRRYVAKGQEIEGLCDLMIGRYERALGIVLEAQISLARDEYVALRPRLDWLEARIRVALGAIAEADVLLGRAERALLETTDWEDLWGIQIERFLLGRTIEEPEARVRTLLEIVAKAHDAGLLLVVCSATAAAAEIAIREGLASGDLDLIARTTLSSSEEAGLDEVTWTLSRYLGLRDLESGNRRGAHSRFAHAIRTIRRVADALPDDHRRSYLETERVRSALESMR